MCLSAGIGAAGAVAGGTIGAVGASSAAGTQAAASTQAAQLQYQAEQAALAQNESEFLAQQSNVAPWLAAGKSGLANLQYLMGILPPSQTPTGPGGVLPTPLPGVPGGVNATATPSQGTFQPGGLPSPTGGGAGPPQLVGANAVTGSPSVPMSRLLGSGLQPDTPIDGGADPLGAGNGIGTIDANPGAAGGFTVGAGVGTPGGDTVGNGTGPQPIGAGGFGGGQLPTTATGTTTLPSSGTVDFSSLVNPSLGAEGSLLQPWTQQFQAPTDVTEQNDPGYQFRLQQGEQALDRSAAARGDILTGGTAQQENQYAQDYASNEYQNVYNRALTNYQTAYNTFQNNQTNTFNRLAAISGTGQTAASQLNSALQNNANSTSNILLGSASNIGNALQNAGAANASGYAGIANAAGGAVSGIGNSLQQYLLMGADGGDSSSGLGDIPASGLIPG